MIDFPDVNGKFSTVESALAHDRFEVFGDEVVPEVSNMATPPATQFGAFRRMPAR